MLPSPPTDWVDFGRSDFRTEMILLYDGYYKSISRWRKFVNTRLQYQNPAPVDVKKSAMEKRQFCGIGKTSLAVKP